MLPRGCSSVLSIGLTDTSWLNLLASLLQLVFVVTGGGFDFNTPAAYLPSYSAKRQLAFTPNLAFPAAKLALLRQDFQEVPLLV